VTLDKNVTINNVCPSGREEAGRFLKKTFKVLSQPLYTHFQAVASILSSMEESLSQSLKEISARTVAEMKSISKAMLADYAGIQDQIFMGIDGLGGICAGVDKLTQSAKELNQQV
jgi:hypothetical protein